MQKVKLKHYIEQIRGVSYKPVDLFDKPGEESVVLLRANNIFDGKINFDDVVYVSRKRAKKNQFLRAGDILICASSGSKDLVGKAAYIKSDLAITFGAFCKVIRPKEIYSVYLGHFFQSQTYKKAISESCVGININNIRGEHIDNLEIPLPSLSEQKAIAEKLDKVGILIEKRKQQLSLLDTLVKSKFVEMFGDFDLRHMQSNWSPIGKVATVVGGSTPKTEKAEYWNGDYCWITPAELAEDSFIVKDTVRKITKEGVNSCSLKKLPVGTVLLSSRAPIGKVAITGIEMYCNQGFKNLICSKSLNPIYVYYLLKFNTDYLNSLGRGATFKEISKTIVENILIPVRPIDLQNQFADFVKQTENSKAKIKQSLAALELLKKSVMQKYFG